MGISFFLGKKENTVKILIEAHALLEAYLMSPIWKYKSRAFIRTFVVCGSVRAGFRGFIRYFLIFPKNFQTSLSSVKSSFF